MHNTQYIMTRIQLHVKRKRKLFQVAILQVIIYRLLATFQISLNRNNLYYYKSRSDNDHNYYYQVAINPILINRVVKSIRTKSIKRF